MAKRSKGMGKVEFQGKEQLINRPAAEIYQQISDLRNFENYMPDQVEDWNATQDACEFKIQGLATLDMVIQERDENKKVVIHSGEKSPVDFKLQCDLESTSDNSTTVSMKLDAELSMMLKMMASRPLQSLVDIMAEKLKEHFEEQD